MSDEKIELEQLIEQRSKQKLTWRELKEVVNKLPEQFLDGVCIWWGEERGGCIKSLDYLEERYYNTDEGYAPLSTFETSEPLEDQVDDIEVYLEQGTPILWVD